MSQAVTRLRAIYRFDFDVIAGNRMRCAECGASAAPADMAVETTDRFEGMANPDDESILLGLLAPCGHRGLYATAYGPAIASSDAEILRLLP